jgi:hypothetical protein
MRRLSSYPRWFFSLLISVLLALLSSGLLLIPSMMEMRLDLAAPFAVDGGLRVGSAALHTTAAFLTMILVGALSIVHMRMGWRRHLNRISGLALLLFLAVLLLSAVGMFYFGDEAFSRVSSIVHTLAGFALTVLFLWHLEHGRRIRAALSQV